MHGDAPSRRAASHSPASVPRGGGAGLPVTETLAVMEAQGKKAERAALAEAAEMIESGRTLSEAFASCGTFPPFFLSMLAVGELSGTLPEELSRLSQYYEKRAEFRRKLSEALAYPLFVFCFSAGSFFSSSQ